MLIRVSLKFSLIVIAIKEMHRSLHPFVLKNGVGDHTTERIIKVLRTKFPLGKSKITILAEITLTLCIPIP